MVGACIDHAIPEVAHIVIEGSPAAPLELIVSQHFSTVRDSETGRPSAVLLVADTVQISADYSDFVDMPSGRIYVRVMNPEVTPEEVRLAVYLDGEAFYDLTSQISDGAFLEYFYTSFSAT